MREQTLSSRPFIAAFTSVIFCALVLAMAVYFSPLDGISGDGLQRFYGRLHPLILHFPIVFLPLALGFELLRFSPKSWRRWTSVGLPILLIAALTACITATLGVLLAANEGHVGTLVERHRLLGVSVAVLAIISLGLRWAAQAVWPNIKCLNVAPLVTLSITCLIMMLAAHDGGSMVHGQNYLVQYAPESVKKWLSASHSEETLEHAVTQSPQGAKLLASFANDIAPIIERNCSSCHGDSKHEGGIRFDELSPAMAFDREVDKWSSVRDALNAHQMPPKEEGRQPSAQDRQQIVAWIEATFAHVSKQRKENRASPMRRLTANEYQNTLQALFGTDFKFAETLPSAPISEHGYSRDAALLSVSALELEYFLSIARQSVDNYVIFGESIPDSEHYLIEFEEVEFRPGVDGSFSFDEPLTKQVLLQKRQSRNKEPVVYSDRTLFPLPEGPIDLSSEELNRSDRQKFNGQYARFKSLQPHQAGELVARIHVAAKLGDDGSAPRLQFRVGATVGAEIAGAIAGECDVTASLDEPQICTFRVPLRHMPVTFAKEKKSRDENKPSDKKARNNKKPSTRLTFFVFNVSHDPDALYEPVPEGYNYSPGRPGLMARYRKRLADSTVGKAAMREAGVNELYLDAIEIDIIPFGTDTNKNIWRIDSLGANGNAGAAARGIAEHSLNEFMQRAYRRSVSTAELESMLSLYDQFRSEGDNFEDALKETFSTVLISTAFLYVAAPMSADDNVDISTEERSQLASRLSYFLWSGPPDERLRELAAQNRLSDPATLASEVDRLLGDKRSRRFSSRFAREWLRLDKFDLVAVNPEFYPLYDDNLGEDMIAETITTFQNIFHQQKDARELISSDIVYINQRLARHYGFPAVTGGEMRATAVPDYRTRGGLLRQGAILTMTADGAESNPVYRGVWILERLLNDPPPPPPPSVPPLDTTSADFATLTLKQKIELHRKQSACSACHANIDPWGLPLENFDAIGSWREQALVINPETSARSFSPIDSSTVLKTGEEINDSNDLVAYLVTEREEEFTRSLTWHMMTYALGRAPNLGDEDELKTIHRHFRTSGYKLSALVLAIAQSEAFQASFEPKKLAITNTQQATIELVSQTK